MYSVSLSRPGAPLALPPEIWLKVFSEVSYIPGVLCLTDDSAIEAFSEDSEGIILHKLYCESMGAKLAISKVCRCWHTLVLPFLFEYVIIKSGWHAEAVAHALHEFKEHQTESEYYGRWIKRVEIFTADQYWSDENDLDFISILEMAPNVAIFSDLFCPVPSNIMSPGLIHKLQTLCEEGSLRRIEWYTGSPDAVSNLLKGTPSLRTLILGRSNTVSEIKISLPNLEIFVLGIHASVARINSLHAPALRCLIMHTRTFCDLEGRDWLCRYFPGLHRLRLRNGDYSDTQWDIGNLSCLETLTFDFGKNFSFKLLKKVRHKTLARLNLARFPLFHRSLDWHIRYGDWTRLYDFMFSLLSDDLPALHTIGFLIPQSYFSHGPFLTDLKKMPDGYAIFWKPWTNLCKERNIRLVASLGADAHFCDVWQPFRLGLLPRSNSHIDAPCDLSPPTLVPESPVG